MIKTDSQIIKHERGIEIPLDDDTIALLEQVGELSEDQQQLFGEALMKNRDKKYETNFHRLLDALEMCNGAPR